MRRDKPIPFPCPFGNHDAHYYGGNFAACTLHGQLLYTDIPPETRRLILHKKRGWKTIKDIANENTIKEIVRKILRQS